MSWNRLAGQFAAAGRRTRATSGEPDHSRPRRVTRRSPEIPDHDGPGDTLDAAEILRVLDDHRVDYVVIGGLAVQTHGHPRTTQDIDLAPEPSPENLARLRDALKALGARPVGEPRPAALEIPTAGVLELDTDSGGVDVHLDPPGAGPYPKLRARALRVEVGVSVLVAGLDDLIAMKRASGRPIDRGDLLALTEP